MLQHIRKTYNNDQQECAVTLQNTLVWLGAPAIANHCNMYKCPAFAVTSRYTQVQLGALVIANHCLCRNDLCFIDNVCSLCNVVIAQTNQ